MKFYVAKNDGVICHYCDSEILRGEDAVIVFVNTPTFHKKIILHAGCYLDWSRDSFIRKWNSWKADKGAVKRPKRGRPRKKDNPDPKKLRNRIKTLINYHKKKGHDKIVAELQKTLPES